MASRKQQYSSLKLPYELVEEILYRIPIEALLRFKSVSKQWYALFNDRKRYMYTHLDLSKDRIMLVDKKSFQLSDPETKAFLLQPTPHELHNCNVLRTFHCDGLLLCECLQKGSCYGSRKLAVWNPVLSQVKWIEHSNPYRNLDVYGFGYDNVSRDNYKILRISNKDVFKIKGKSSEVEIYEFKSKLWRSVVVDATLECEPPWTYASMNGNMYWVNSRIFIQSFDFSTETFKTLCCVPDGVEWFSSDHSSLVLSGFGRERLSLLQRNEHVKIDVWVTNKVTDDGIVSWSKYFNVSIPDPPTLSPSLFNRCCSKYLVVKTNKILLWCEDVDERYVYTNVYEMGVEGLTKKQVEMTERARWDDYEKPCVSCVFVPSLVPVPE
ncbi:unnamed protein product [Microthlaspi erraticum]|uniref:F-box domain-containing protein n=1 Tax=Microthlaspi erraticum TaxID=1685480 RepID=A0A6D2J768_9BRAS|nr:unnamed protein product [Microthlaspi erraticum]